MLAMSPGVAANRIPFARRRLRRMYLLQIGAGVLSVPLGLAVVLLAVPPDRPRASWHRPARISLSVVVGLSLQGAVFAARRPSYRRLQARGRAAEYQLCPRCGYDVSGVPAHGRSPPTPPSKPCPECGTHTDAATAALWRAYLKG